MNKRPISVTILGGLFFIAGVVGLVYHSAELRGAFHYPVVWVLFVRLLAVVGAVFLLKAHNWARWLLVAWMAFHVGISALHSLSQVVVHGLLMALVAYFLFRRSASEYFLRPKLPAAPQGPNPATK